MDGTSLYPIGELARRTGVPVRTIRFYSDEGVLVPAGRSPAGYRLYDLDALLRLELVRTLRELGMDLATVRRVLDRTLTVARAAAVHADAVDIQIRTLRMRRSVLRAVAARGSGPEETTLMHRFTQLSGEERRRLVEEFTDAAFAGTGADPAVRDMVRAAAPELPDDPTGDQIAAWVELAGLLGDEDFRRCMSGTTASSAGGAPLAVETGAGEELTAYARQRVTEAREAGHGPHSPQGALLADDLVRRFALAYSREPGAEFRRWMAAEYRAAVVDPRVERYWELVWVVNGWQVLPSLAPVHPWLAAALEGAPVS
ncbi:MerR family transcriptional regulator [Streptomyces nitrosporeus]|uniref:MerR family transcriptional regulator n=1 Tax=Streptomyces nitrosporeus TaxID=28894 RepID=A0A5J6F549_9ACTN|nr:MerR family transcriptional regulator [Streptomyces nitrosporeus]QEU71136.1 MerR family transcriptional regulator [Streptomyces nitrosporeus]GGZ15428.1 MerR family transcriptional regulator [Streptomyces nitrosporeus]